MTPVKKVLTVSNRSKLEQDILARLFNYIAYKDRTSNEVKTKLRRLLSGKIESSDPLYSELLDKLFDVVNSTGLIDDEIYVKRYIEALLLEGSKPMGPNVLIRKLRSRGISSALVERYLPLLRAQDVQNKKAQALVKKKLKTISPPKIRSKMLRYLYQKGFDLDVAKAVVDSFELVD